MLHQERLKFNSGDRFTQFEYFRRLVLVSSLVIQAVESAVGTRVSCSGVAEITSKSLRKRGVSDMKEHGPQ